MERAKSLTKSQRRRKKKRLRRRPQEKQARIEAKEQRQKDALELRERWNWAAKGDEDRGSLEATPGDEWKGRKLRPKSVKKRTHGRRRGQAQAKLPKENATKSSLDQVYGGTSTLPRDYTFLPSGDVYMTRKCRKETLALGRPVYAAKSSQKPAGIYVPASIKLKVRATAAQTLHIRQSALEAREKKLLDNARTAIRTDFPSIPAANETAILSHAFAKSSGRVGRCSKLPLSRIVWRAVEAHIRHMHVDYDKIADTNGKGFARKKVRQEIEKIRDSWRAEAYWIMREESRSLYEESSPMTDGEQ